MKRLSEVTVLTRDLDAAAAAWLASSGLKTEITSGEGRMEAGDVTIRLLGPHEGSHFAGLIEQRGEGMFDLAVEVEDLPAAVDDLRAKGVQVSDPMIGENGHQEAMIDPASSHGVPIRLVERQ